MNTALEYIIIQAGGKGTRMGHLCANKPKALTSINGQPLIIRIMKQYPEANFLIIADYKQEVLKKYLRVYAPSKYEVIETNEGGTCAGISRSIDQIPAGKPLAVFWCDLFFEKEIIPPSLKLYANNYIGLSKSFPCRWKFENNQLTEEKSNTCGVAGIYIFKDKDEIGKIPVSGEFCRFLQETLIEFAPYYLTGDHEVGTLDAYTSITKKYPVARPFNDILIKDHVVIKYPRDKQGENLAVYERGWYDKVKINKWNFIPRIFSAKPLKLERIYGDGLFNTPIDKETRKKILKDLIENLKTIHASLPRQQGNFYENNFEAIVGKTKRRLDSVASLIPFLEKDYIRINGKLCINFYKRWDWVEDNLTEFFSDEYCFIHGDCTFSNTLYDEETQQSYLIDPRGYFGKVQYYGDIDYDWAKLYYSLVGNYDKFNTKDFRLYLDNEEVSIVVASNGWEDLASDFFQHTKCNPIKIEALHAIIWLSLSSYVWDDYDSICGAFFNGIYYMQHVHEKISGNKRCI